MTFKRLKNILSKGGVKKPQTVILKIFKRPYLYYRKNLIFCAQNLRFQHTSNFIASASISWYALS